MELESHEISQIRKLGIYLTSKCDGCGKVLNQSFRYTLSGHPEEYCSDACWQNAYEEFRKAQRKHRRSKSHGA